MAVAKDASIEVVVTAPDAGKQQAQWKPKGVVVPKKPWLISRIFFFFVGPLIRYGYSNTLQDTDLYQPEDMRSKPLYDGLEKAWEAQLKKPKPDLKRALLSGNAGVFVVSGILYLVATTLTLAGPLLLQRIVAGLQCQALKVPGVCEPIAYLYYYAIGICVAPLLQSIAENQQQFMLSELGTRMRNSLMAAIYRKCLRLSNSAIQTESTGKVVTLMSNDAQKLQDAMFAIHTIWGSPLYIIVILALLYRVVGWATFVGAGVMFLLGPVIGKIASKLAALRKAILQWTDKRISLMNELINGMQMIKFNAWEDSFKSEIMKARGEEAKILKAMANWQGFFGMMLFSGPVLVAVFCFGSFSLAGQPISTAQAYAALALFSLLRFPMSFLPMLITMIVNALVAVRRISDFLRKDEAHMTGDEVGADKDVPPGAVRIAGGEFAWDDKAEAPVLEGVDLEVQPGKLVMIVGSVGSGKSSVLGALIGHMTKRKGSVAVGGRVAYVAQSAWIMNETLQENVLLGGEMDAARYTLAVDVAQLHPDLLMWPNGDRTEIGDRGVTLSGGQKQRVSIARAVYADADVYLLDDPLSAVDSHVGRALFEQCIRGALCGKTVVLVTNALQYLPEADHVVWMVGGKVKAQGSYKQLVAEAGLDIEELAHIDEEERKRASMDSSRQTSMDAKRASMDVKRVSVDAAAGAKPAVAPAAVNGKATPDVIANGKAAGHAAVVGADAPTKSPLTLTRVAGAPGSASNTDGGESRNLTGIEVRESGSISRDVLRAYFVSGGGVLVGITLLLLFAVEQGARVYTDRWVGNWFGDSYSQGVWFYLGIYAAMGIVYGLLTYLRALRFLFMCVNSALSLHNQLLDHILRLPKTFFDTNPAGRILNRFSRDMEIMDSTLSASLIQFAGSVAIYISVLIVIAVATRWFAIALVPLTLIYYLVQRYYIPTARELQRIESVSRSPIYSKFAEALNGIPTIRAYRKAAHFTAVSDALMEGNAWAYMTQKAVASWLAVRLDLMGIAVLVLTAFLCIQGNINPGLAGLVLVYALDITRFLKHGTAMASKSESDFNSVERIVQYLKPETEGDPDTHPDVLAKLPPHWPDRGAISVSKLEMRYRPEMPLVLKGLSFDVHAGERTGIVGRTGSGKSSLFLTLFRLVECEGGSIVIDGVDVRTVGLKLLRSKMSIIPQDPFMYSGSVRHNLDPFDTHGEEELWLTLEAAGLRDVVEGMEGGLEAKVVDNGSNFSLGQRQLFSLARAMLRQSRILMLDEATASVDLETDNLIQQVLRTAFESCTMLIIAHRLNTIMDCDRVLVLDAGKVVENDEPIKLLEKKDSLFTSLVQQTGKSSSTHLQGLARVASANRTASRNASMSRALAAASADPSDPVVRMASLRRAATLAREASLLRATSSKGMSGSTVEAAAAAAVAVTVAEEEAAAEEEVAQQKAAAMKEQEPERAAAVAAAPSTANNQEPPAVSAAAAAQKTDEPAESAAGVEKAEAAAEATEESAGGAAAAAAAADSAGVPSSAAPADAASSSQQPQPRSGSAGGGGSSSSSSKKKKKGRK